MTAINGRVYTMWSSLVENKSTMIGRTIVEVDDVVGETRAKIADVVLRANGDDSAWFCFVTEDGVECGGDVRYLGISGNADRGVLVLRSSFGSVWEIEGPPALRVVR